MRIKKINYTPSFVKDFGDTSKCIKYGIFDCELVGVIFELDGEIGFYTNESKRNQGYMYNALKEFLKKGHTLTVDKLNIPSNNLLKKLKITLIKSDYLYNYYKCV